MDARVVFADESVKESYEGLASTRGDERRLREWLERAFEDISKDAFTGTQIPKRQIPKKYVQMYGIDNLWKYDLPQAWRLLYSVSRDDVVVIAIVLEWLPHKKYERRFGYD